ncbi:WD40 repeat-like protein [Arthrobotrys musiformis]|uniref:WD40 repeat-like protein n=1 Tax=Arthrobotrys musiformis TaxID=47236 RepID=A0AAV9WA22_9PEZI
MSIKRQSIWASNPTTARGQPTHLSSNPTGTKIAYASNKSIFLRDIDTPSDSIQYTGHTANATVARFAPSGYYVASGDASGMVRVWDCVGEELITKGEFPVISGRINDIAWDSESKRIIAVGEGRERYGHCMTWDTGNSIGEISGHSNIVNTVAIKPTRPYRAATGGDDNSIVFYHGPPFKFNTAHRAQHTNFVQGLSFSPDGTHLVSVGSDRKIFLWDGKTGDPVSEIKDSEKGHTGSIFGVSWNADAKRFVTASADRTVKIWDLEAQKVLKSWSFGDTGSVLDQQTGVVWPKRSDGILISISNSGNLNYLDERTDKQVKVVAGHQKNITSLGVEPNGKTIWTGSYEGRVCFWDLESGTAEVPESQTHTNQVINFAASEGRIYSIGMDDTLRTIDTGVKDFTGSIIGTDGQPRGIAYAADKSVAFVVTLAEVAAYKDGKKATSTPIKDYTPTSISYSSSTNLLAIGADNNNVYVYQLSQSNESIPASPSSILKYSRSSISALAFAPNSALLAVGDSSGKIILFDASTGNVESDQWTFHNGRVKSIAWNKAGTHIVSGSLDTNIIVYSAQNYSRNTQALGAHKEGCNGVEWIDDSRVVSVGADGCVKLWAVVTP